MWGEHGAVVVVRVRGEGGDVESVERISVAGGGEHGAVIVLPDRNAGF